MHLIHTHSLYAHERVKFYVAYDDMIALCRFMSLYVAYDTHDQWSCDKIDTLCIAAILFNV